MHVYAKVTIFMILFIYVSFIQKQVSTKAQSAHTGRFLLAKMNSMNCKMAECDPEARWFQSLAQVSTDLDS